MEALKAYVKVIEPYHLKLAGLAIIICYVIYAILTIPPDEQYHLLIREPVPADKLQGASVVLAPKFHSGGEYTFQTWMYIDNYEYRSGLPKHVFTIGPPIPGRAIMVGILYPNENKMMIRVNQKDAIDTEDDPDMTKFTNLQKLFRGRGRIAGNGYPICDLQEIPLKKWVFIAIVVTGRVIDVYMDGKLSRSCVTQGIPYVECEKTISLGRMGGWGGSISATRFFGYALTPALVNDLYMKGPTDIVELKKNFGFIGFIVELLGQKNQ
jgi:hypothetical protein